MFSCEIWKIFKNIFLKEHLWRLLLLPKQVKQTKIQILHEYFCWNTMSAVTLEKLCYNKARLNKAPCFGELKENTWFFLCEICRNKSLENFGYLESVNLLSFNSSFMKMDTKRKFLLFLSVKQFLRRKEKSDESDSICCCQIISNEK